MQSIEWNRNKEFACMSALRIVKDGAPVFSFNEIAKISISSHKKQDGIVLR